MEIYSKINSTSGADFAERLTINGKEIALKEELTDLENRVKNLEPVVSVGSFFMDGTQNQYEGFRIKIISDTDGNVSEVITGKFVDGTWQDETGIQAAIYGMAWDSTNSVFKDPEIISYKDGTTQTENTFDKEKIMPWAGIKYLEKEETVDGVTFKQYLAGVPKFYYTGVQVSANTLTLPGSTTAVAYDGFIQIVSSVPLKAFKLWDAIDIPDATVFEEYVVGDKEVDYVYDPVYRPVAMNLSDSSIVTSYGVWNDNTDATGNYVLVSQPTESKGYPVAPRSADIFARKINEGAGYDQTVYNAGTWQQFYRMKLLYRIEFNTINSQSVMNGQVYNSATSNAAGWTEPFICKAVEACIPYSGTMDFYEKKCAKGLDMANGCFQNPLIYRYHSDLFSCPYQLPANFFIARDPENSQTINYYLGNCRECVLNWTGSKDETSCLSDYVQYYDAVAMCTTGSISMSGQVKSETWEKNGIFTIGDELSGSNIDLNGYGDDAYVYVSSSNLPISGACRFSPVWLTCSRCSYAGLGASAFRAYGGYANGWGVGNSDVGSGLSVIF